MAISRQTQKTYQFQDVVIFWFDIHTAIDAIATGSPSYFRSPFRFLINPAKYRKAHQSNAVVESTHFRVQPLARRVTRIGKPNHVKSHFWCGYRQIAHSGKPDTWKQQLPFIARPKFPVSFASSPRGCTVNVHAYASLNTLGWSTTVRVRIQGKSTGSQLIKFINSVSTSDLDSSPWQIEGNPAKLTDIFRLFESHLRNEVYAPDQPPHPKMHIPRFCVIGVNRYAGPLKSYHEMTDAEKGLFRGILYGKKFTAADEVRTRTEFPGTLRNITISAPNNFGLVDWNRGSLICAQSKSRVPQKPKTLKALRCLSENMRSFFMVSESARQFLTLQAERPDEKGLGMELKSHVTQSIKELPTNYRNQVCAYCLREQAQWNSARYSRAALRYVLTCLIEAEFESICFDCFPDVRNNFTAGQNKTDRVIGLITHAESRKEIPKLLEALCSTNAPAYQEYLTRAT